MAFESGTAYAESDADDEYERSVHDTSSLLQTDSEASPTDSEGPSSSEHTPTTYGHQSSGDRLPETIITEWTTDECADYVSSLGLRQYADPFIENEIVGEALVALHHEDLKQMGISSVGHRLTILKSVYDIKVKQDIPIEVDNYVPLSADAEAQYATATLKDIKHLVDQLRIRDERMSVAEMELRRVTEEYRRLREDLLPVFKMAKEGQPLPYHPDGRNTSAYNYNYENSNTISPPATTGSSNQSGGMSRKYSTKKLFLGSTPKNVSPTHMQHGQPERSMLEQALDPSGAAERAVVSSAHLAAHGSQPATSPGHPSPGAIPSPGSPPVTIQNNPLSQSTLASRSYRSDSTTPSNRNTFDRQSDSDAHTSYQSTRDSHRPTPHSSLATTVTSGSRRTPTPSDTPSSASHPTHLAATSSSATPNPGASVEIFKSFRVSMEDPCYKVLPAALKKYNINAPWEQYALYIVYAGQERCLGLDEKPLILFKQLDKEGKMPMFMLRKRNPDGGTEGVEGPGAMGDGIGGGLRTTPGGII